MFRTLTGLALALLVAAPASATPFTWLVEGQITHLQNLGLGTPYDGAFTVGQPFSWWITMESSSPDFDPNPACGQYTPIESMRFASGSVSLSIGTRPGQDYLLNSTGGGSCVPPYNNYARLRSDFGNGLFLSTHFWGDFTTDALPVSTDGLSSGTLDLFWGSLDGNAALAHGAVTSITSVPEPTELVLMFGAVAAVLRRMRRPGISTTEGE